MMNVYIPLFGNRVGLGQGHAPKARSGLVGVLITSLSLFRNQDMLLD